MSFIDKIVDAATSKPARGILTGYVQAKVNDTIEADKQNGLFIQAAAEKYFNEDKPQFVADEKLRYNNFLTIKRDKGLAFAQYADSEAGGFATTSLNATKNFLNTVEELRPDQIKVIESNYNERKKGRVQTFNEKNAYLKEYFKSLPGGLADNVLEIQLPDEGKDVSVTGIKQGDTMKTTTQEPTTGLMDINNVSGVYNFNEHGTERREFINFFNGTFRNPVSGAPEINVGPSDPRYDLQQFLKEGYEKAKKSTTNPDGFVGGEYLYMMNKFVDNEFKKQGITGYPTGFSKVAEETKTEIKAAPGDGQKFDAPDVSKIGVKEDVKINLQSKRQIEGGGSGSPAVVINDLREIIAKISDSPSLSDDEKEKRIEVAKDRARERIKSMGLDLDQFNI